MFDEIDYPVGYKRPPKNRRFQPCASGNPKGRPKGTPNVATLFRKILYQKVRVNCPDGRRWMSKLEVVLNQLVNRGLNGDPKAIRELVQWAKTFGDAAPVRAPPKLIINFVEAENGRPKYSSPATEDNVCRSFAIATNRPAAYS